jgi:hypothetical protein
LRIAATFPACANPSCNTESNFLDRSTSVVRELHADFAKLGYFMQILCRRYIGRLFLGEVVRQDGSEHRRRDLAYRRLAPSRCACSTWTKAGATIPVARSR